MHFLLSSMSVVYVLTTPMPEDGGDDATVEQIRKRAKWDNDDYICRGLILNGMSDSLFDIYQNVESSKELWDSLEAKYMAEDASSKKFLVSNFTNYKMTDSRPVLKQYNELLGILGRFTQHKINMDESIQVSCIIDKLSLSWKDFKHTLKHLKEELTLVELGSHLRIEESLRATDRGGEYMDTLYFQFVGVIHEMTAMTELKVLGEVVRLPDPKLKTLGERGIECIFVGYVEHSKAFRFYVIEPNDSVSINSIIESRDVIKQ
ncbi:zinc finger, CCHC-type containing protein [Tanacetum coccineum]